MTKIYMRVCKGQLEPADALQTDKIRNLGLKIGDVIEVDVKQLRSVKFNNLVHQIGQMMANNCDSFNGLDAHTAIKRLQLEGCIECDLIAIKVDGYGIVEQRTPRSISFSKMSEDRYRAAAKSICELIAAKYWVDMSESQIENMAKVMVQ